MTITDDTAQFLAHLKEDGVDLDQDMAFFAELLSRVSTSAIMEAERPDAAKHRKSMTYWVTIPLEDLAEAAAILSKEAERLVASRRKA